MKTRRCTCGAWMDGTSCASRNQQSIVTVWLCARCLRRLHTSEPNTHFVPMPKPDPRPAKYKCYERTDRI